ncbi:hypothetical protein PC123_g7494 [Phytophthora cactorum]|nr:hypothetical protein PC123_g7494 [Phytophthora cactorum]
MVLIAGHWSTNFTNCWKKAGLLDYYTSEYADPGELLNPSEEKILMEDPTDEDYCRVDTNSETRLKAS